MFSSVNENKRVQAAKQQTLKNRKTAQPKPKQEKKGTKTEVLFTLKKIMQVLKTYRKRVKQQGKNITNGREPENTPQREEKDQKQQDNNIESNLASPKDVVNRGKFQFWVF